MIAMAVAAVLIVIIGRRLTGSGWAGLFAGLIMALTPSISFYAQTARSYAMVFACVARLDAGPDARHGGRGGWRAEPGADAGWSTPGWWRWAAT